MYPEKSLKNSHISKQDFIGFCYLVRKNVFTQTVILVWFNLRYMNLFKLCEVPDMCTLIPRKQFNKAASINDKIFSVVANSVDARWLSSPTKWVIGCKSVIFQTRQKRKKIFFLPDRAFYLEKSNLPTDSNTTAMKIDQVNIYLSMHSICCSYN